MRRLVLLTALLASLAAAPGAAATTFTVDDTGDAPDANTTNGTCATSSGKCTLRAAIEQANAPSSPAADSVVFSPALGAATIRVGTTPTRLPPITAPLTIEGGGDITIAPSVVLTLPLLVVTEGTTSAAGSTIRDLAIDGDPPGTGRAGPLIRVGVDNVTIDHVVARNSSDDGIEVAPAAEHVRITRSPVFAYSPDRLAIDLEPGANGDIAPPQGLRVGPRRGDGSLPVTGTSAEGVVELFRGDPLTGPQVFALDTGGGSFAPLPDPEPSPGEKFSATVTDPSGNTSEFATAATPFDVVSPSLLGGVATSLNQVRLQPSEPIDPASAQVEDFSLVMAGSERPLAGVDVAPGGSSVTLTSSIPWLNGEAGTVALRAPAALADPTGNQSLGPAPVRVGGAPGDFIAPAVTSLKASPKSGICITKGPRCKKPGTYVSFVTSEDGEAVYTFVRGKRTIGTRRYPVEPGRNKIRFDGRIRGRKMTAGRYKLYVAVEDAVGNITFPPPRYLISIRSTTRRR